VRGQVGQGCLVEAPAIRNHAPREVIAGQRLQDGFQPWRTQRFAAGEHQHHPGRVHAGAQVIEEVCPFGGRQFARTWLAAAVAAAMEAGEIAALDDLDEQVAQHHRRAFESPIERKEGAPQTAGHGQGVRATSMTSSWDGLDLAVVAA